MNLKDHYDPEEAEESNQAPSENPLQTVLEEFQKKRLNYINQVREKSRQNENSIDLLEASDEEMESPIKPTLEQFLIEFEQKVKQVNLTYKSSKLQFQTDMRSFKESDIQ